MDIENFKKQFSYIPLGVRLNNIGCIRYSDSNNWNGQQGNYKGYCNFVDFQSGVRALVFILMKYLNKYHLFDVRHMMQRYAPCEDNNSPYLYAHFISSMSGLEKLSNNIGLIRVQIPMIVYYISCMENGSEYIKLSMSVEYRTYLFELVRMYIDEYLEQVVYPIKGKVTKL